MVRNIKSNFILKKKAFGGVVSTLIMFIAIVGVSTGMVIAFQNYIMDTQSAMKVQNDASVNKLKAIISITNIYYNSSTNDTYIYVKNIGEVDLYATRMDLFIDGKFTNNYTSVYADNLTKELVLLKPQDTTAIIHNEYLPSGTHTIRVVTQYSSYAEDSFNN